MDNSFQNSTIAQILEAIIEQSTFEGESNSEIADILLSILNQTPYDKEPCSVIAELLLKLKAKIEGESFDPYDKAYTGNIAEIILSILNDTEYTEPPRSRIAELFLQLKEELETYTELTISGAVCTFETNVSKPLVSLKANFKATQESGTPTPSDPKAINGVSSFKITSNGQDIIINLSGTYYGGCVEIDKDGKRNLVITHKIQSFNDGDWRRGLWGSRYFYSLRLLDAKPNSSSTSLSGSVCEIYTEQTPSYIYTHDSEGYCINNDFIRVQDNNFSSLDDWKEAVKNYNYIYELAEPIIIDISDGDPIVTLIGENNIYNNSGDTEVTYLYKGEPPVSILSKSEVINNDNNKGDVNTKVDLIEFDDFKEW